MMNLLPPEVLILVLKAAAFSCPKNDALGLRLVCREFDGILKPLLCDTVSLDVSKLSKRSCVKHPDPDALQTIGHHCKSLFVDLMVLRDPVEIHYLQPHVKADPSVGSLCEDMRKRYCMGPTTFTEEDFRGRMDDILFNCRDIERARLSLPLPFVVSDNLTATFILANALAALGRRPEEDSATLKVLVLENLTGGAIRSLSYNPLDRLNIMTVFGGLDHLVLSTKGNASYFPNHIYLTTELWRFIGMAESLKTLCLVGLECGGELPLSVLRHSRSTVAADGMPLSDWLEPILPPPFLVRMRHLTSLELRRMDLTSDFFLSGATSFGSTLRELYLNRVCLKIRKAEDDDGYSINELWVGPPNTSPRPMDRDRWIAHIVRNDFPQMRVCRATHLSYDFYGSAEDLEALQGLDIDDPCGLKRDLAKRFVEVAMGYEQPDLESGEPCTMYPCTTQTQTPLKPFAKDMQPSGWDVAAYHDLVANPTSRWLDGIDGYFPNDRSTGATALRDLTEAWCRGLNNHPHLHFHPDPPDSGFHIVYEDDIPLGLLIGRIGPRRLHQFRVGHGDDLDDDWVPIFEASPPWSPTEPSDGDSGEEGDGESDGSISGEEGDNEADEGDTEEESSHESELWEHFGSFLTDDPAADMGPPVVYGYVNDPTDPDGDAYPDGVVNDGGLSPDLIGNGERDVAWELGLI